MFGGPRGLSTPRLLDLPTGFRPLAAADFDGDGSMDLLDGGRGGTGDTGSGEPGTAGALLYGPFNGPRTPAVGDADGDGTDDLLMPTRLTVAPADMPKVGGALTILYGARSGLGTGRRETVIGNRDTDQRRIDFGASPAVGDVNGDHRPDVVVNTPDFRRHDGRVTLLPGGPDGVPSAAGEQPVDAGTKGLPGTPNPYYWNAFNHQPPLLDVDGDGHADAVVFAPLYEKRKGAFLVLRGTDAGFDPKRVQLFTPDDLGTALRLP